MAQNINIMIRIKVHPFNYKTSKNRNKKDVCRGVQCLRAQTINIYDPYTHKVIQTKTIYHKYQNAKGVTFGEMVYDSMLNSPFYGNYMKKFAKR